MTPIQKLPKNDGDLGKFIVAKGFKKLPKVQKIAQSGHTELTTHKRKQNDRWSSLVKGEEMNNWMGPIVKHVWNDVMDVVHIFSELSSTQQLTTWADTACNSFY